MGDSRLKLPFVNAMQLPSRRVDASCIEVSQETRIRELENRLVTKKASRTAEAGRDELLQRLSAGPGIRGDIALTPPLLLLVSSRWVHRAFKGVFIGLGAARK